MCEVWDNCPPELCLQLSKPVSPRCGAHLGRVHNRWKVVAAPCPPRIAGKQEAVPPHEGLCLGCKKEGRVTPAPTRVD